MHSRSSTFLSTTNNSSFQVTFDIHPGILLSAKGQASTLHPPQQKHTGRLVLPSFLPSLSQAAITKHSSRQHGSCAVVACQSKLPLLLLCAHAGPPIIVSLKQSKALWADSTRQLTTTCTACRQQHWLLRPYLPLPVHHHAMLSHNAGQSGHTTKAGKPAQAEAYSK